MSRRVEVVVELNDMEASYPRVANYNVSVSEIEGKVVFLRKLARGGSEHSFGIHVAKLAGMPSTILKRADQVLSSSMALAARRLMAVVLIGACR